MIYAMKTNFILLLVFSLTILNCNVIFAQTAEFDPNTLKTEYYKDASVVDGNTFKDKQGNRFKIKKTSGANGLYIDIGAKGVEKWVQHGVWYDMGSDGHVYAKTIWNKGKKHGVCEKYHANGKINFLYTYVNDLKEGTAYQYNDKGEIIEECPYVNGLKEGVRLSYHSNGQVNFRSTFHDDLREGEAYQYNDKGEHIGTVVWIHGVAQPKQK